MVTAAAGPPIAGCSQPGLFVLLRRYREGCRIFLQKRQSKDKFRFLVVCYIFFYAKKPFLSYAVCRVTKEACTECAIDTFFCV